MKKWIALAALFLLLTACGKPQRNQIVLPEPEQTPAAVQTPAEAPVEEPTVEVPPAEAEPAPSEEAQPEAVPENTADLCDVVIEPREGLVEDSIGYSLALPVFSNFAAADSVNQFYLDLVNHLENYTKETVYTQVLEKGTMANVFGTVLSFGMEDGEELRVVYELRVEFADGSEPAVNTRTDYFQMQTGEVRSETD